MRTSEGLGHGNIDPHPGPATDGHAAGPEAPARAAADAPVAPAGFSSPSTAEQGRGSTLDRRLYLNFRLFTACPDTTESAAALPTVMLDHPGTGAVVYQDWHDPRGIALLAFGECPAALQNLQHAVDHHEKWECLEPRYDRCLGGRSYSLGYETDLPETLLHKPVRRLQDLQRRWAIWYPLRRSGAFARLPQEQQREILAEHGGIGRAWGEAGLAQDVRLACHGLDINDNDFVIGLVGESLTPLSKLVQAMRGTVQTSTYLESIGPFFVGHALYQSQLKLEG